MRYLGTYFSSKLKPAPWNKGKLTGQKLPLQPKHVWAIRTRLQLAKNDRDLALFNVAIDSKLRGCDLVRLKREELAPNAQCVDRVAIRQRKTGRPVKFELTEITRQSVEKYLSRSQAIRNTYLFPGRKDWSSHLTIRQYARLVSNWISIIGLDSTLYGTHSLRRTKATIIYRHTGNLRAVQLLLGHSKIVSTVRYLGVEVDDAPAPAEMVDI